MTTEATQTLTIYMRPAPRLPKLIALAAIYWRWMEHIKNGAVEIVLKPIFEGMHPPNKKIEDGRSWEYHLDCCGNGYRERGMKSELEVVMHDFEMADAQIEVGMLLEIARAHNVRETPEGRWTPRNIMNKAWGSLGFFSGSAWLLISEAVSDLSQDDFIKMTIEVILEALDADYTRKNGGIVRNWREADDSKPIEDLLFTKFQGKLLGAGNFEFPTLSGYIRDMWMNGKTESMICAKLEPWMSLWRTIERKIEEAAKIEPQYAFGVCRESRCGVAFDFSVEGSVEGMDNPLLHKGQLSKVPLVIVRTADGGTGIFGRGFTEASMEALAKTLQAYEPGLWFYEGGSGIYNKSKSRAEILPSRIPIHAERGNCLIVLAQNYLRPAPPRQRSHAARR